MAKIIGRRGRAPVAAALAGIFLASCSGGSTPGAFGPAANPSLGGAAPNANARVREDRVAANGLHSAARNRPGSIAGANGWLRPDAMAGKNLIYSGSYDANSITIYSSKGKNPPPIGTITAGLSNPERLFVDRQLKLYATNIGNNTIVAYKPGGTSPSLTIADGVNSPTGVVVGGDGTVYCANVGNDTVTSYKKGKTKVALTISLGNATPENLAVDAHNNLYVAYEGGTRGSGVIEYPPGQTSGTDLNLVVGDVSAVEVDRQGNVIIIDGSGPSIDVFPAGATKPSKAIPVPAGSPFELSLGKSEKQLYASVEVGLGWAIQEVAYPNGKVLKTKISNSAGEWPLAVSPDNAL
jgi:hypothetical protein